MPRRIVAFYAAIFAVAFASYAVLWRDAPVKTADSAGYMEVAQDLSDMSLDRMRDRTPGYPLLLLATGSAHHPKRSLFYVSLLFQFVSIFLLATILDRLGASNVSLRALAVVMVLPPFVESAGYVLTENLTQVSLIAGLTGLVLGLGDRKAVWLVLGSLAVGFSALVRPTYQALGVTLAVCLAALSALTRGAVLAYRSALRAALVLAAGSFLLVGGFCLTNYVRFQYFGLTPFLGSALSTRTSSFVERLPASFGAVREELVRSRNESVLKGVSHTGSQYIFGARPRLSEVTGLSGVDLSRYLVHLNLVLIRHAPLEYLASVARDVGGFWLPATTVLANFHSRAVQSVWVVFHFVFLGIAALQFVVLAGLSLFALSQHIVGRGRRHSAATAAPLVSNEEVIVYALAVAIIAYTVVVSCMVASATPRHRTPTDALILFLIFLGVRVWYRLASKAMLAAASVVTKAVQVPPSEDVPPSGEGNAE